MVWFGKAGARNPAGSAPGRHKKGRCNRPHHKQPEGHRGGAEALQKTGIGDEGLRKQLQEVESQIAKMKIKQGKEGIAVFKWLGGASSKQDAENWLLKKIAELVDASGDGVDVFSKGDFKGIRFCKFNSINDRDKVIDKFRIAQVEFKGARVKAD